MGSFNLSGMTFGSLFKKPETIRYPYEQKPAPSGLKGHIENSVTDCILCGICQKTCPTGAIVVDKATRRWTINPFQCVQCGSCVRACPKDCLSMLPTYTPVATKKYCTEIEIPDQKQKAKAETVSEAVDEQTGQEGTTE